jgi:hypothetical protein
MPPFAPDPSKLRLPDASANIRHLPRQECAYPCGDCPQSIDSGRPNRIHPALVRREFFVGVSSLSLIFMPLAL